MKSLSISLRIALITGSSLLLAIVAVVSVSLWYASQTQKQLDSQMDQQLSPLVTVLLLAKTRSQAADIGQQLAAGMGLARYLADTLEAELEIRGPAQIERQQLSLLIGAMLQRHPDLSGAFIVWEPDAIDAADRQFRNQGAHSNENGQFAPYWFRDGETVAVEPIGHADIYNPTRLDNGSRQTEWYYCPLESTANCIAEPYSWEANGQQMLGTSLTAAIRYRGKVVAVAGVDTELSFLQQLAQGLDQSLYQGAGRVRIFSQRHVLAADSDKLDPVAALSSLRFAAAGVSLSQQAGRPIFRVVQPIVIEGIAAQWTLVVDLPAEVALAASGQIRDAVALLFSDSLQGQTLAGLLLALLGLVVVTLSARSIGRSVSAVAGQVVALASQEGDLTKRIALKRNDEIGSLARGLDQFIHKTHEIVSDVAAEVGKLQQASGQSAEISTATATGILQQRQALDQVAAAVTEMSANAQEVAANAEQAASATANARAAVDNSAAHVDENLEVVRSLTEEVAEAARVINQLEQRSQDINQIVEVIRGVSEQTNLLALNAAIEAARAGDAGRGFAVVADEVRTLAGQTQQSTAEIQQLIEALQQYSAGAVAAMRRGENTARQCIDQAESTAQGLNKVVSSMGQVDDMATQIAGAAGQQYAVSESITESLTAIRDVAAELAQGAEQSDQHSAELSRLAQQLDSQISRFRY